MKGIEELVIMKIIVRFVAMLVLVTYLFIRQRKYESMGKDEEGNENERGWLYVAKQK